MVLSSMAWLLILEQEQRLEGKGPACAVKSLSFPSLSLSSLPSSHAWLVAQSRMPYRSDFSFACVSAGDLIQVRQSWPLPAGSPHTSLYSSFKDSGAVFESLIHLEMTYAPQMWASFFHMRASGFSSAKCI